MIKKSIVALQFAAALLIGALIIQQFGMTPESARKISRHNQLWLLNLWRPADMPASPEAPGAREGGQADASEQPLSAAARFNQLSQDEANRRYILSPDTAVDAVVAGLQAKGLPATEQVFASPPHGKSAAPAKTATVAVKKTAAGKAPQKPLPATGDIRLTALTISPTSDGAVMRGHTSLPVERADIFLSASPYRMILELTGRFAPYDQPIAVPANSIFRSVTAEVAPDKMRIVGVLLTDKVSFVRAGNNNGRDSFSVDLQRTVAASDHKNWH